MPQASKVNLSVVDNSYSIQQDTSDIVAVMGVTEMGPFADPSVIIRSFKDYKNLYGGLVVGNNFPLIAKEMLDRGTSLRISRVGHYTDPTDASTLDATKATAAAIQDATDDLFTLTPKYAGAAYAGMSIVISDASNGKATAFNLAITFTGKSYLNELYENLEIIGAPTAAGSTYLESVVANSKLVNVTYEDLSGITPTIRPDNGTTAFTGGSDGTAPVAADYVGDAAAKTGIHSFDAYDDMFAVVAPNMTTAAVLTKVASYASGRGDLIGIAGLGIANATTTALLAARDATNIDTSFAFITGGGAKTTNPLDGSIVSLEEAGIVAAIIAKSRVENYPWASPAGLRKGKADNLLDVVNNFGGDANYASLNSLSKRQVNMLVRDKGRIYLAGNNTGQLSSSDLSFLSARMLLIYIKKSLAPTLNSYLEEPNDIPTWRKLYAEVRPFMDNLVSQSALWEYAWRGDQDAHTLSGLTVNTEEDVRNGKYKVELYLKIVNPLIELNLEITLADSSVSFNEQL